MRNLVDVHSSLIKKHIKLFENVVTVDINTDYEFQVSVIWNDTTRLQMMQDFPDVLGAKASIFIDYETLYNLNKDIMKGSTITGKPNKFEEEKTYQIAETYFDKHMAVKVCFLKDIQSTEFSEDL